MRCPFPRLGPDAAVDLVVDVTLIVVVVKDIELWEEEGVEKSGETEGEEAEEGRGNWVMFTEYVLY